MTTRPGYIWSGTEWVQIGQEAIVAPISYQTSAPSTPATGDIWIDSDDDVPGIDTSQFLRWRKTMAGGETSLSGTDDNGLTLKYTPNYEQLYINGVLQVRAQDYTATNGTSITGLTALAANDVVEVFGVVARTVGDVYTQAQADSKYSPITTTGLVLVNTTNFTSASTVSFDNVFSSVYKNYRITFGTSLSSGNSISLRFRSNGSDNTTSNYSYAVGYTTTSFVGDRAQSQNSSLIMQNTGQTDFYTALDIFRPQESANTYFSGIGFGFYVSNTSTGNFNTTTQFDGFSIISSSALTGTIKVYGYK